MENLSNYTVKSKVYLVEASKPDAQEKTSAKNLSTLVDFTYSVQMYCTWQKLTS